MLYGLLGINECVDASHFCENTNGSNRCLCPAELSLANDSRTREGCLNNNGGCQQICVTITQRGKRFDCLCYELINEETRKARGPQPYLLFSNGFDIQRMNFDGTNYSYVKRSLSGVYALDLHYMKGKIYYATQPASSSSKEIREMDFSGGNDRCILNDTIYILNPEGIAVDWVNDKLYWTDRDLKKIVQANLNETNAEVIVDNLQSPRGIVIHPYLKYVI